MSHNSNDHQSRRHLASHHVENNSRSNLPASSRRQNLTNSTTPTSSSNSSIGRPVTRSVTKRNLQQQNDPTATLLDANSNSHDINNNANGNEKILKLIESRQQQIQLKPVLPPQKTYQKIIVNERPCNIVNMLERRRMGGLSIKNTSNMPDTTLCMVSQRLKTHDYPLLIKRLDQSSITINLRDGSKEVEDLLRILQEIENRLMNYVPNTGSPDDMANSTIREEFEVETINLESARVFRQYGGIEIFKRILLLNLLIVDNNLNMTSSNHASNNFSPLNSTNVDASATSSLNSTTFLNQTIPPYSLEHSYSRNASTNERNIRTNDALKFFTNSKFENINNKNSFINNYVEKCDILKIKCKCIQILNRLVCLPNYGKLVVSDLLQLKTNKTTTTTSSKLIDNSSNNNHNNYDTTLLQYLFTLLMFKESRLQACQLIESILLHMPMLNLNRISNIKLILERIDDDGLSCICKIFAVTLSNLDMNEKKYLASGQKRIQIQKQRAAAAAAAAAASAAQTGNLQQQQASSVPTTSANSNIDSTNTQPSTSNPKSTLIPTSIPIPPMSVRDQNQELLLRIPTLLSRLVYLVRRKDYAIRYSDANSEIEHWIRYIDQALSDTEDNEFETAPTMSRDRRLISNNMDSTNNNNNVSTSVNFLNRDFNSTSNESSTNGESSRSVSRSRSISPNIANPMFDNISNQPALLAAAKLNNFVYVLYTLSLLLIGKEKKKVQINLTKLRLASALNSLFDYLIWNCRCEYPNSTVNNNNNQANNNTNNTNNNLANVPPQPLQPLPIQQQQQMRSHICPEVAVKIQFLRLVHSFCDHSESKRVVLSQQETDEILTYNKTCHPCLKVDDHIFKVDNRFRCTKENIGLLSKIVLVIKQEPFSASFRFWLIRAIESFLRGNTSYADQLFLIKRGIVEDTVQNILAINFTRPKEVLQSCFDMLGELVKFNTDGFDILNKELIDNEKFNMLFTMINQSLIDSNMFLRSIFLSIDFFENNSSSLNYKIADNKILSHFNLFDRRVVFLCRMISIININNLSQENVSCLNTTLIVLMLANRKKTLPKYLLAIKAKSIEMLMANDLYRVNSFANNSPTTSSNSNTTGLSSPSNTGTGTQSPPLDIVTNFRDLLIFWQSHYLQKDKDCGGLEQNSRIDFSYWKETVELLLDPNPKNEWSLNFYLQNDLNYMTNNNKNRIDELRSD